MVPPLMTFDMSDPFFGFRPDRTVSEAKFVPGIHPAQSARAAGDEDDRGEPLILLHQDSSLPSSRGARLRASRRMQAQLGPHGSRRRFAPPHHEDWESAVSSPRYCSTNEILP